MLFTLSTFIIYILIIFFRRICIIGNKSIYFYGFKGSILSIAKLHIIKFFGENSLIDVTNFYNNYRILANSWYLFSSCIVIIIFLMLRIWRKCLKSIIYFWSWIFLYININNNQSTFYYQDHLLYNKSTRNSFIYYN